MSNLLQFFYQSSYLFEGSLAPCLTKAFVSLILAVSCFTPDYHTTLAVDCHQPEALNQAETQNPWYFLSLSPHQGSVFWHQPPFEYIMHENS